MSLQTILVNTRQAIEEQIVALDGHANTEYLWRQWFQLQGRIAGEPHTTITSAPSFLIGNGEDTKIVLNHKLGTKRFASITLRVLDGDKYLFTNPPTAIDPDNLEFNFSTPLGVNGIEVILSPIAEKS